MAEFPDFLIEAARFERDTRAERYPRLVQDGKLTADEATIDYQCWFAIAGWFESGQMHSIEGGIDGQTIVDWVLAEDAAEKALTKLTAKADTLTEGDPAFAQVHQRRANLVCIHRAVQLRRQSIETINRQLREQRQNVAEAA